MEADIEHTTPERQQEVWNAQPGGLVTAGWMGAGGFCWLTCGKVNPFCWLTRDAG